MDPETPQPSRPFLSREDLAGLDALVDAGFHLDAIPAESGQSCDRIARLLSLLDSDPPDLQIRSDRLLVDVTMARVLRERSGDVAARIPSQASATGLGAADGAVLDSLVDSGWDADTAPEVRDSAVGELLSLLDTGTPTDTADAARRADLIESTLSRVQSDIDTRSRRFRIDGSDDRLSGRRSRFGLSDLIGLAAMFVLGTAVLWPVLVGMRESARQSACAQGLQRAALGFSLFASDHDGRLPKRTDSSGEAGWWNVGHSENSHSSNLFLLIRENYARHADLACPGNANAPMEATDASDHDWHSHDEVSYSYRLFRGAAPRWQSSPQMIVLVDKSPIVARAMRGESFDPLSQSRQHRGRGQNVLYSDGSVQFLNAPLLPNGDLIWLPRPVERRTTIHLGRVRATDDPTDTFVGP